MGGETHSRSRTQLAVAYTHAPAASRNNIILEPILNILHAYVLHNNSLLWVRAHCARVFTSHVPPAPVSFRVSSHSTRTSDTPDWSYAVKRPAAIAPDHLGL